MRLNLTDCLGLDTATEFIYSKIQAKASKLHIETKVGDGVKVP